MVTISICIHVSTADSHCVDQLSFVSIDNFNGEPEACTVTTAGEKFY